MSAVVPCPRNFPAAHRLLPCAIPHSAGRRPVPFLSVALLAEAALHPLRLPVLRACQCAFSHSPVASRFPSRGSKPDPLPSRCCSRPHRPLPRARRSGAHIPRRRPPALPRPLRLLGALLSRLRFASSLVCPPRCVRINRPRCLKSRTSRRVPGATLSRLRFVFSLTSLRAPLCACLRILRSSGACPIFLPFCWSSEFRTLANRST